MKAGLATVPVLVRSLPDHQRRLAALTENMQREDLNPMEAAEAVRLLMDEGGLTQEAAAGLLGKSRPALANLLRLLSLPAAVQRMVREGRLSEGHARVLARCPGRTSSFSAGQALEGGSVRARRAGGRRLRRPRAPADLPRRWPSSGPAAERPWACAPRSPATLTAASCCATAASRKPGRLGRDPAALTE